MEHIAVAMAYRQNLQGAEEIALGRRRSFRKGMNGKTPQRFALQFVGIAKTVLSSDGNYLRKSAEKIFREESGYTGEVLHTTYDRAFPRHDDGRARTFHVVRLQLAEEYPLFHFSHEGEIDQVLFHTLERWKDFYRNEGRMKRVLQEYHDLGLTDRQKYGDHALTSVEVPEFVRTYISGNSRRR